MFIVLTKTKLTILTASSRRSLSSKSASLKSRHPLSEASIVRHGEPVWKACLAAFTALSTSACKLQRIQFSRLDLLD
jgi:hypothetical protein